MTNHHPSPERTAATTPDVPHDSARWQVHTLLEKRRDGETVPYETIESTGNMLVYGGASALWDLLVAGGTVTAFNNANAYIGVGDSSTAAAAAQTDLQAATNKHREAMDATYPQHTDGTGSGAASIIFKATFESGDAEFAWNEWGIFNASTSGRMLNRKVQAFGTKPASTAWSLTVTITLA
jgi:hypothetical protein